MSDLDTSTDGLGSAPRVTARQVWIAVAVVLALILGWLVFTPVWPDWVSDILISKKAFVSSILNGLTLAGLYFLVASGFTLVFGLMRNVNLAHGSLYLLGAYVGYEIADRTGYWPLGVAGAFVIVGILGIVLQVVVFRRLEGDDLRQTLVTIGISIVAADLMLAVWAGGTYQILVPDWLAGSLTLPIVSAIRSSGDIVYLKYPLFRLMVLFAAIAIGIALWLMLNRTRVGMMIRAGVDDREMLSASGVNVHAVFAIVFAVGAGLAGLAGVIGGSALSVAPGEDVRYLLASLVVVIVGGMGSITGAAIGALLIGLAEQMGLVYFPTYGIVVTFLIMVVTLAVRPQGIMGASQ
jgi:branched-chain amino acid transport system permease protein